MEAIINFFTGTLNTVAWLYIFLPCTIIGGLYLTIRNRGIQFTRFGYAMKNTVGKMFQKQEAGAGAVTPLQAVTTALAATVGTGNIVGTSQAIALGDEEMISICLSDKLHQPYRMPLMPGSKEVFDMARLCGAKAVYVSGAGSTVMAVAEKAEAEKFYSKLEKGLELLEGLDGCEAFTLLRLDADNTGATVE